MDHDFVDTTHIEGAELSETLADSIDGRGISVRRPLRVVHESKSAVDGQRVYVLSDEVMDVRGRAAIRYLGTNTRGR
jgi:hypothetical protein